MVTDRTIKLKLVTIERIDQVFLNLFSDNSHPARKLAKQASWDFKINSLIDKVEKPK